MPDSRRAELETLAKSGGVEDDFNLALDLLARPQQHEDWVRAIDLLETAAARGHAGATEQCALLDAIGVARRPDWNRAFDRLARAASLGSRSAADLLSIYVGDGGATVDLTGALRVPPARVLSSRPLIRVYEGFASAAECAWMIGAARDRLRPATVYNSQANSFGQDEARSNSSAAFEFADMDLVFEVVRTRISRAVGIPVPAFEAPQVLNYHVGQEFRPHVDYLEPTSPLFATELARRGQRAATFLIYLSEDFDGGVTQFPRLGIDYRGRTGDAILFANIGPTGAPDPDTMHAGLPPTRGEKWLFSQWIRDRAPG